MKRQLVSKGVLSVGIHYIMKYKTIMNICTSFFIEAQVDFQRWALFGE